LKAVAAVVLMDSVDVVVLLGMVMDSGERAHDAECQKKQP
jgi:hypothetical protein